MSFEIELRRSLIRLIKSNRPRQMERRIENNHTHYTTVMDHIGEEDLQSIFAALRSQSSEVWIAGDWSGNCPSKGYTVIQDHLQVSREAAKILFILSGTEHGLLQLSSSGEGAAIRQLVSQIAYTDEQVQTFIIQALTNIGQVHFLSQATYCPLQQEQALSSPKIS